MTTLAEQFIDEIGYADTDTSIRSSGRRFEMRMDFIHTFGFVFLTTEMVERMKEFGDMLEVGAGSGYVASELQDAGVNIIPTNPNQFDYSENWQNEWTEIERLDAVSAIEKYPDRTVLISWPCYRSDWSTDVLNAVENQTVIYIGENRGGCTATDSFFDIMDDEFDVEVVGIPSLEGVYDNMYILNRK